MRRIGTTILLLALVACTRGTTSGTRPVQHRTAIPSHAPTVSGPAITGTIRTPDGHLAPGVTVYAEVQLSKTEQFFRGFKAFASLGLGCLDSEGCTLPEGADVSALDGTFAIPVPKGGTSPKGVTLTVVAEHGESRVATAVSLPVEALLGTTVGVVPIAGQSPTLLTTERSASFNPPRVPGAHPGPATVTMSRVQRTGDSQEIVDGTETDVSNGVDLRLVEDARVLLQSTQQGHVGSYKAVVSASIPFTGTQVPPSRQAACHLIGGTGQKVEQQPCQLTDGALDQHWDPTDDPACTNGPCTDGTQQRDHRDTYVELKTPTRATLLVVRGCGPTCHVFVTDTTGTHALPEPTGVGTDALYSARLSGLAVREVHIVTATGGFLTSLREVSLWA